MTTLMNANAQWTSRPADQRYASLEELHAACVHHHDAAVEAPAVPLSSLRVEQAGERDIRLSGSAGVSAGFTHWSFGQVSRLVGAPADYVRNLPAPLAVECLNHGLATVDDRRSRDEATVKLLFQQNGDLTLKGATGKSYCRIWDDDITERLLRLKQNGEGWQEAPAAYDGSRGQYASDCDMFSFLVDNDRRIFEHDPNGGLARGFFVSNSTVGAASFCVTTFLYEYICGNHIVWGAKGVQELRIRHVGNADDRAFAELTGELRKYADASASETEAKLLAAQKLVLGKDKDEVLDRVFGLNISGLTRGQIGAGYDKAVERVDRYGDPRTAWALTNGLTEISQHLPNTNDRTKLDRAAGKVLTIAF